MNKELFEMLCNCHSYDSLVIAELEDFENHVFERLLNYYLCDNKFSRVTQHLIDHVVLAYPNISEEQQLKEFLILGWKYIAKKREVSYEQDIRSMRKKNFESAEKIEVSLFDGKKVVTAKPTEYMASLVKDNKKIFAIKEHRSYFGSGLAEAKAAIESLKF